MTAGAAMAEAMIWPRELSLLSSPVSYTHLDVYKRQVLEYGTSWALEKLFHAYWWDYSSMPLNINGRVCFPYSVGFGVAGLIVVYFIAPFTKLDVYKRQMLRISSLL